MKIPNKPSLNTLPFWAGGVVWDNFESFTNQLFQALGKIKVADKDGNVISREIISVKKPGSRDQKGADLIVTMDRGETWIIQCKHHKSWSRGESNKAFEEMEEGWSEASRYILVLSIDASLKHREPCQDPEKGSKRDLWDASEITNRLLVDCEEDKAFDIITRCFSIESARHFFPYAEDKLPTGDQFFSTQRNSTELFHHKRKLVGRQEELDQLTEFISSEKQFAMILSAPGGMGKSKLLEHYSQNFDNNHPSKELRFSKGTNSPLAYDELRRYPLEKLVLVLDDAHREELVDKRLLKILASPLHTEGEQESNTKKGKTIVLARPQATDAIQKNLIEAGYTESEITEIELKVLSDKELLELASSSLNKDKQSHAQTLASIADNSPFLTTIAAQLINKGELKTGLEFESTNFHEKVMDCYGASNLEPLCQQNPDRQHRYELLLGACASLSPFQLRDEKSENANQAINQLAEALDRKPLEVDKDIRDLKRLQLLVKTEQGHRVYPDLYADHLVYRYCMNEDGSPSLLCNKLIEKFEDQYLITLLRNFADVQWRAKFAKRITPALTDPLCKTFQEKYKQSPFSERYKLLAKWFHFALYLPEETLELCDLVTQEIEAPAEEENEYLSLWKKYATTPEQGWQSCLSQCIKLLESLAIHHSDMNVRALDQLLSLHKLSKGYHIKKSLIRIADYLDETHRNPSAADSMLNWLWDQLSKNESLRTTLLRSRNAHLEEILHGLFEKEFSYTSTTDHHKFTTTRTALGQESFSDLRAKAYNFIGKVVIPSGDIGCLNICSFLIHRLSNWIPEYISKKNKKNYAKGWKIEQMRALEVLEQLVQAVKSPIAKYFIYNFLHSANANFLDEAVKEKLRQLCQTIDTEQPDFLLSRALYSSLWNERSLCLKPEELFTEKKLNDEKGQKSYEAITAQASENLAIEKKDFEEIEKELTEFIKRAELFSLGAHHSFSGLLVAITKKYPKLTTAFLEHSLKGNHSVFGNSFFELLRSMGLPEKTEIEWTLKALQSNNQGLLRSALGILSFSYPNYLKEKQITEQVLTLASSDEKHVLQEVCRFIGDLRTNDFSLLSRLLQALNYKTLKDKELLELTRTLGNQTSDYLNNISEKSLESILKALSKLPCLSQIELFLLKLNQTHPFLALDFYWQRLAYYKQKADAGSYSPFPVGFERWGLSGDIPITEDYKGIGKKCLKAVLEKDQLSFYYRQFYQFAFLKATSIGRELIEEKLSENPNAEELENLVSLLCFDGSLVATRYPILVRDILIKAEELSPSLHDDIQNSFIRGTGPSIRSYNNGKLDKEYTYGLEEAKKGWAQHAEDPYLGPLMKKKIKYEESLDNSDF